MPETGKQVNQGQKFKKIQKKSRKKGECLRKKTDSNIGIGCFLLLTGSDRKLTQNVTVFVKGLITRSVVHLREAWKEDKTQRSILAPDTAKSR